MYYGILFGCLLIGFWLLFYNIRWLEEIRSMLRRTRDDMEEVARQRLLSNRRELLKIQREHSIWYRIEQELNYSGWKRIFPDLTAEKWILYNVAGIGVVFGLLLVCTRSWKFAGIGGGLVIGMEYIFLLLCKMKENYSVSNNLIKFLDFLGNYSITGGEVTGVFKQVSRYVEEPIKGALEECCYEAQVTGDCSLALLAMAEKIEHPGFKELIKNMEISIRYCADFSALVQNSRRSIREYLSMREERKGMLREAAVNMALLMGMSVFALLTVDQLIEVSIWYILWNTLPGKIAMGIVVVIWIFFVRQLYRLNQ